MANVTLPTTRVTLLTQLRQVPFNQAGWDEFVERYGRHIYRWCRQWNLPGQREKQREKGNSVTWHGAMGHLAFG